MILSQEYKLCTRSILQDIFLIELYEAKTGDITIITQEQSMKWLKFNEKYNHPGRSNIGIIIPDKGITNPFCNLSIFSTLLHSLCLSLYPNNLSVTACNSLCFHSCTVVKATSMLNECLKSANERFAFNELNIRTEELFVIISCVHGELRFHRTIYNTMQEMLTNLGYSVKQVIWNVRDKDKSQEYIYNALNNSLLELEDKYECYGTISGMLCNALSICPVDTKQSCKELFNIFGEGYIIIFPGLDAFILPNLNSDDEIEDEFDEEYNTDASIPLNDSEFVFPDGILVYDSGLHIFMHNLEDNDKQEISLLKCNTSMLLKEYIVPVRKLTEARYILPNYNPMIIGIDNYRLFLFRKWIEPYCLPQEIIRLLTDNWLRAEVQDAKQRLFSLDN